MYASIHDDGRLVTTHYRDEVRDAVRRGTSDGNQYGRCDTTVTIPLNVYEDLMLVKEWARCEFNRQDHERWKAEEAARKAKEGESE